MTPSEIAGRLMMLSSQLEHEKRDSAAQACAEAAALILIYLDKTTGNGGDAYDKSIKSTPVTTTVTPLFGSILKKDL
jgi:hypothetical protein